mmetsp:Transcript_59912/g.143226  ORF Transcript_59912/g.143226 Transcript_59912/m.143226 type:complete len:409 (-) Transcript_59912:12-1238(-)|eukprot:CAMPEP_0180135250 /NCGR_PEP_ID=MMETSP0986-20121125/10712_1 /TAXON_ID=697907 /ORGANISM="non described non described, Strain CCMP2293" /LENGTH=408 /DNA_ID=CAMNT_0022075899 /DNA_START=22 /DNA_END=1248 /DNA_ORIENTATION=+
MSRPGSQSRYSPDLGPAPQVAKQAGVGLMLGENTNFDGVVVKQLVPKGAADRTGKVKVGDQLLQVGDQDVSMQTVTDLRHLIIGEIGSIVEVMFKSASTGEVYAVQLQRGTPEYLDGSTSRPDSRAGSVRGSVDSMGPERSTGSVGRPANAREAFASMHEENDWLRSALKLAESHITRDKEELKSLHSIFDRQKEERDARVASLEEQIIVRDGERREADARAWAAEEARRAADQKLGEAARREHTHKEEARKVYENEQMRLEYIQELKRRFEEEKSGMVDELVKMQDGMRVERAKRVDLEATEHSLRQDLQRLKDAYRSVVAKNNHAAELIREQAEHVREIQRQNSSLTILLSEIQPRLTVLEQDVFSNTRLGWDSVPASSRASPVISSMPSSALPLPRDDDHAVIMA